MKMWMLGLSLCCFSVLAPAQSCNNKNVAASGVGGVAGSAIGAVMLGPAGEVLGGAVGGAVGSVVANGGKAQPKAMLGGAVGGAGGAILGRGLGGRQVVSRSGSWFGERGRRLCCTTDFGSKRTSTGQVKETVSKQRNCQSAKNTGSVKFEPVMNGYSVTGFFYWTIGLIF